jgi:hypothetical protein
VTAPWPECWGTPSISRDLLGGGPAASRFDRIFVGAAQPLQRLDEMIGTVRNVVLSGKSELLPVEVDELLAQRVLLQLR